MVDSYENIIFYLKKANHILIFSERNSIIKMQSSQEIFSFLFLKFAN